ISKSSEPPTRRNLQNCAGSRRRCRLKSIISYSNRYMASRTRIGSTSARLALRGIIGLTVKDLLSGSRKSNPSNANADSFAFPHSPARDGGFFSSLCTVSVHRKPRAQLAKTSNQQGFVQLLLFG